MVESMTGFGRGTAEAGGVEATVEVRSVNNRYCEVSARLPRALAPYEAELQQRIKQAFGRGRITVQVQLEQAAGEELPLQVDPKAARAYAHLLEGLRAAAGIEAPVRLEHLLTFSEVFTTESQEPDERAWAAVSAALDLAIEDLRTMRRQEGVALRADLEARLDALEAALAEVERRAPERVDEARARLYERLNDLLADDRLNPERLELEIALLADRLDVSEECVRLHSHLQLFREALEGDASAGRKLNFLVQEINREVNTIGSKANDAEVAHLAVRMKEELEKIREQVQNVE